MRTHGLMTSAGRLRWHQPDLCAFFRTLPVRWDLRGALFKPGLAYWYAAKADHIESSIVSRREVTP